MKTIIKFKQNKWYNLGDVNPRLYGGIFVKRDGDEIEVVSTDNNEETYGGKGYTFNSRIDYVSEIVDLYEKFKKNLDKGIGSCFDWKRYIKLEKEGWTIDEIVMYLASDMIGYYGGDTESENDTNYWERLGYWGIRPNNF